MLQFQWPDKSPDRVIKVNQLLLVNSLSSLGHKIHISHHTNRNNLLVGLRRFSGDGAGTSQILDPETVVLPDDVSNDVSVTRVETRKGVRQFSAALKETDR